MLDNLYGEPDLDTEAVGATPGGTGSGDGMADNQDRKGEES